MEEYFISGYCRAMDASRTVMVEVDGTETVADCSYGSCPWADTCPIGHQIGKQMQ